MSDTTEPTTTAPGEGATTSLDPVKLAYMIADYDRMTARVEELERTVRRNTEVDARRSSVEVGTPAKGGALKVYFDPFAPSAVNDAAMTEAKRVLEQAGGSTTAWSAAKDGSVRNAFDERAKLEKREG